MKKLFTWLLATAGIAVAMNGMADYDASATTDESGNTPVGWLKFDGNVNSFGSTTISWSGDNTAGEDYYENSSDSGTNKAAKINCQNKQAPYTGSGIARATQMSWITRAKLNTTANSCVWAAGGSSTTYGYAIVSSGNGKVAFRGFGNSSTSTDWNYSNGYTMLEAEVENATLQYHNFVVTYDGSDSSTGTNTVKLYVDGVEKASGEFWLYGLGSQNFQIGNVHGNKASAIAQGNGNCIDEWRRYNKVLSADEIAAYQAAYPVWPDVTTYTYDCDAETPAWSPTLPDELTSLCALKYIGTGTVTLPSDWKTAAAVEAADTITITGVEIADVGLVSGSPIFKYTDDSQTSYTLSSAARYEFTNGSISQNLSAGYTLVVKDGDAVSVYNESASYHQEEVSMDVSGGTVTMGPTDGVGYIWYGSGTTYNQTGGTFTSTVNGTGTSSSGSGLLLGYSGALTMNISGGMFTIANSSLNFWAGNSIVNISGTADVKVKGVFKGSNGKGVVLSGGTFELGSIGYQGVPLTLNGGTLKAYESTTISSDITIGGAATVEVPTDVELKLTGSTTGEGTITKTGAGVLNLGTCRPVVGEVEGTLKFVATTAEIAAKKVTLATATGLSITGEMIAAISTVLDAEGNALTVDATSSTYDSETGTIILVIASAMPVITEATSISTLELASDASGTIVVVGAESEADAYTVTFDAAIPSGVTLQVSGYVTFVTSGDVAAVPVSQITLDSGAVANLTITTSGTYSVPAGWVANAYGGDDGITLTLTNNGTFNVVSGKVTMASNDVSLQGTINIPVGTEFVIGANDQVAYGGSCTFNVRGTLNMGGYRQTFGSGNVVNAYASAVITGTGTADNAKSASFDPYWGGNQVIINAKADDGEGTVTLSAPIRARASCTIFVDTGMTLEMTKNIVNVDNCNNTITKTGAGKLVMSGSIYTSGTLTVSAGTLEFATGTDGNIDLYCAYDGSPTLSGTGTVTMRGQTINLGSSVSGITAHFIAASGTSTLKWTGNADQAICDNDSISNAFITVNSGATLNIYGHDYSGWNGKLRDTGWVVNNGTIVFQNDGGSRFWREHLVMGNGAVVNIDNGGRNLLAYGGSGTADACQFMLAEGTAKITSTNDTHTADAIYFGNDGQGGYGDSEDAGHGAGFSVGEEATLTVEVPVAGSDTLTKWGAGTLVLACSDNDYKGTVALNAGMIKSVTELTVKKGAAASGCTVTSWIETDDGTTYYCYGLSKHFVIRIR